MPISLDRFFDIFGSRLLHVSRSTLSFSCDGVEPPVAAAIRRDGGRCTFVDEQGHRCRGTRCMEYHHEKPYGKGGQHALGNIALRCRAHNQYQADLDFSSDFMRVKRRSNNSHSPGNVHSPLDAPL